MTTAYPLAWPEGWPRTPHGRRAPSKFKTRYERAYENLVDELRLLGAKNVVISSNAPLRVRDGRPYTDPMEDTLPDPGVAVYFQLGEPQVMARDAHPTPAENLHAIGHVIAALRNIERHGGSHMMKRAFAGFVAIEHGPRHWTVVLGVNAGATADQIEAAYRQKAKQLHPDAGGSDAAMAELNRARLEARNA